MVLIPLEEKIQDRITWSIPIGNSFPIAWARCQLELWLSQLTIFSQISYSVWLYCIHSATAKELKVQGRPYTTIRIEGFVKIVVCLEAQLTMAHVVASMFGSGTCRILEQLESNPASPASSNTCAITVLRSKLVFQAGKEKRWSFPIKAIEIDHHGLDSQQPGTGRRKGIERQRFETAVITLSPESLVTFFEQNLIVDPCRFSILIWESHFGARIL